MSPFYTPQRGEGAASSLGNRGRKSNLFQTPQTDDRSLNSRKRSRPEPSSHRSSTSLTTPYALSEISTPWNDLATTGASIARSSGAASPPPMVNTKYALAGGLDTPLLARSRQYERDEYFSKQADVNFRSRWDGDAGQGSHEPETASSRPPSVPNGAAETHAGWGNLMFRIVGGVAGKVWEFCSGAAFKGFHAGGGQGYSIPQGGNADLDMNDDDANWEEEASSRRRYERESTPVPGQYPSDDDDYLASRPAKRLHTDTSSGWVVVEKAPGPSPSPYSSVCTPLRRSTASRPSLTPISRRKPPAIPLHARHPSNASIAPQRSPSPASPRRRTVVPSPTRPSSHGRTSSASLRSPAAARVRISSASQPSPRSSRTLYATPTFGHSRSFSGERAQGDDHLDTHGGSPGLGPRSSSTLSPEAMQYLRERDHVEQRQEVRMRRMQRQLNEMLKQGKEALGSRVEVVYSDEGEGRYDGGMDFG